MHNLLHFNFSILTYHILGPFLLASVFGVCFVEVAEVAKVAEVAEVVEVVEVEVVDEEDPLGTGVVDWTDLEPSKTKIWTFLPTGSFVTCKLKNWR